MKHYGIVNPEGYNITNLTAPSGIADPANPNAGELFFRTDTEKLRIHNGTSWTDSDAGGFSELVGDTSPQLGGDLDVNGQSIISVSNGDITLAPDGTGVVTTTALYLASNVDASLSDDGPLVIGNKSSLNLNIDSNEIMARDNGGASILYLNHDGGDVLVGSLISFTVNEIFAVNGNIQCDTFVSHSGTAGTFSLYQNTETSETGPVLVMYGTTHASKGRTRLIGSTQTSSGTDVSHVFDNHNGTTTDNILTLYADKSATFSGDASINGTLNLGDADLSAYVSLKAPDTTTTSRTWVLPQDDPATAAGYFLKTDASGNMSFAIPSGSGMSEVIDDTTPQLGGNLDVNGQSIVSVSDGDINITPDGTGVVSVSGNLLLSENIIAPGGTDDTFVLFQNAAGSDVGPALTMRGLSATSDAGAFTFISCTNQNTGSKKTHRFINYFGTDYESWLDIYDNGLVAILGSASIGGSTSIGGNTSIGGTTTIDGDIVIKTDDGAATALIIWNSNTISVNPDIEFSSNGLISAEQSLYINVATSAAGTLKVGYGDRTNAATYVFEVGESVFQYNGNDILTTASGSGLSDIIEDITPQLGGDLDVNGKSIVSVDGNDITLVPSNIRAGTEEDDFTSDDIAAADVFGISSAIDGDTCIIGARSETAGGTDAGAAYVFTRTAGVWTQQQKIISSDLAAGDKFGYSVAIYGDTVVVGARYKNSEMGAVYVFTRSGSTWTQQQKLEASDKAINDAFGYGVTIYGDTVAVSAPYESTGGTNAGSVYVFTRTDTTWTEQQKLNPSPLVSYNRFGYSVSLYQDRLAVGAQGGGSTNTQGSAYTFTRTDTTWTQEQFITASDREYDDIFGWSICLYDTTLLVGASRADLVGDDNAGAAYFYKWSGSSWGSEQIVQASDLQAGDNFGYGVSVNNTIAIISSPWEDTGGDGSGAIYTFYYNGTAWVQQEKIQASDRSDGAKFGWSVAVNGNTGIIGAPITATGGDVYSFTFADESASVIIESNITSVPLGFQESGSGTDVIALVAPDSVTTSRTWTLPQDDPSTVSGKFLTTDASGVLSFAVGSGSGMTEVIDDTTPQLGGDLDVNGQDIIAIDGDIELLLDSPTLLESWTQEQKIVADNAGSTDEFGWAVAVSGDTAIVGAPWEDTGADNAGSAYIFIRTGTTWTLQQRIQGGTTGGDDRFGWGVGIDGDTCIIGAYKDDVAAYNAGAAFIFTRSGSTWTEQQHIYASDAQDSDSFGKTVAISGDTCIVGADEEDTGQSTAGAAYIFTRSGLTWTEQQKIQAGTPNQSGRFGSSVDIDGDSCIVGSYNEDSTASGGGAAYVFTRSGVTWTEQQRLLSSDIEADDYFGWSVGIDGDICVVGAYYEDTGASGAGAAYVFTRSDVTWTQQEKIQSETPETNEQFGYSVDISNGTIIIGARYEDFGTAYVVVYSGSAWIKQQTITAGDGASGDWFGTSVAIDNDVCIVGAPDEDAGGSSAGAAYMFDHDYSSSGNIILTSSSFVSTQMQFNEAHLGTESIGLKSPNSITTSRTWTLPQDDPATASGKFLTTDASGVLSFASAATAPAGDDTEIQFNNSGSFGSSSSFTISNTTLTAGDTITVGNATGGRIQTATSQLLVIQPGLGSGQMSIRGAQNDSGNGGLTVIQGGYSPNNTAGETQVNGATSGGAGSTGGIISMVMGRGVTNDGWVELNPAGTGPGNSPVIRMYSDIANQSYYTAITSGNGLTASRTWILPQDDPSTAAGKFLTVDASGVMSFTSTSDSGLHFDGDITIGDVGTYTNTITLYSNGLTNTNPDILFDTSGAIGAHENIHLMVDGNNDGTGALLVREGGLTTGDSAIILTVSNSTFTYKGNIVLTTANGMTDVIDDTTPQLGGNLDVNGKSIVSTSNGDITLAPDGSGDVVLSGRPLDFRAASNTRSVIYHDTYVNVGPGIQLYGTSYATDPGAVVISSMTSANAGAKIAFKVNNRTASAYEDVFAVYDNGDITANGDTVLTTATGFSDIIEDTTPQLGGDLDVNGNNIISNNGNDIIVSPSNFVNYTEEDTVTSTDIASGDEFGAAVAIDGDTAVVGAISETTGGADAGAAYVFTRTGDVWTQQQKIVSDDLAAGDNFGNSVAVDGDTIAVGCRLQDTGGDEAGAVYVFTRSGETWTQEQKIQADDKATGDRFGHDVALEGDNIIIGAYSDDTGFNAAGAAYVFTRSGSPSTWTQQQKLVADDPLLYAYFGYGVAMYGESVVIGAFGGSSGANDNGAAYVFTRSGSPSTWTQQQKLTASDAESDDYFGYSVDIYSDTVIVGAYGEDTNGSKSGAAYVFTRDTGVWTQEQKLTASDAEADDLFGADVTIESDTIIIGAHFESTGGAEAGAAYAYNRIGTTWTEEEKIISSDLAAGDKFGNRVAIEGGTTIISARNTTTGGDVYTFTSAFVSASVRLESHISVIPLEFVEASGGTDSVSLLAPDTITTSRTWILPQDDPSTVSGKFLTTDANGVMSFAVGAGSGMTDVIDDTTPQLGGDLDVNGQSIVSVSDGDITLAPNGTGVISVGKDIVYSGGTSGTLTIKQDPAGFTDGPELRLAGRTAGTTGNIEYEASTNDDTAFVFAHTFYNRVGSTSSMLSAIKGTGDLWVAGKLESVGLDSTDNITVTGTGAPSVIIEIDTAGGAPGVQYKDSDSKIRGWVLYDDSTDDFIIQKRSAAQIIETSIALSSDTITLDSNTVVEGTLQPTLVVDYQSATDVTSDIRHNTDNSTGPIIRMVGTTHTLNPGAIKLISCTKGNTGSNVSFRIQNYNDSTYDDILTIDDDKTTTFYGGTTHKGHVQLHPNGGSGQGLRYNDEWTGSIHTSIETGYCGLTYLNTSNGIYYLHTSPASVTSGNDASLEAQLQVNPSGDLIMRGLVSATNHTLPSAASSSATFGEWNAAGMVVGKADSTWDNAIAFRTAATERIRIDKTGLTTFKYGVTFDGNLSGGGGSGTKWSINQYVGSSTGPSIEMAGTSFATDPGKLSMISCTQDSSSSSVAHALTNYNGSAWVNIMRTNADGAVTTPVKYTKAHIGDTNNTAQVVTTSYLKSMVDDTARGSSTIATVTSYTLPAGIWTLISAVGITLEIHDGTDWRSNSSEATGTFISDGTNVRLYNSTGGTLTYYYLKQGLQR